MLYFLLGLLLYRVGAIDCESGGTLSFSTNNCLAPNYIPECTWIQNNLDTVCSNVLTNSEIVKVDDSCYADGSTCSFISGNSATPNTFCCSLAAISSTATATAINTPVIQLTSSSRISLSPSASRTCSYRVYNSATDFSSTQGSNGWYYGYYNGANFAQFTNYGISSTGSVGSVNSWNYNSASNGIISGTMIMQNGDVACNTATYGDIAPVLRWYNPPGSCYQDITIWLFLSGSSNSAGSIIQLKVNGIDIYSYSGVPSADKYFNVFGVRSVELSIGPINSNCDYGQTSYTLNIAPIGPTVTALSTRSLSSSSVRSISSGRTTTMSASPRVTVSSSTTATNTGSISISKSSSLSATATATVFYTGNWTDYGAVYWNVPLSNTGSETISQCMIRCSLNEFCGGISVNTPCYDIPLNSPNIYTTICANCFLIPMAGVGSGGFVTNAGWQSFIIYDKMFPPTESSRASVTQTVSALPTASVVTNSTLNICTNWGRSVTLPFINSSITLITNAPGTNYVNGLGCNVFIYGAGVAQQFLVNINSFSTEAGRDFFRVYNSLGTQIYINSGNLGGGWHLYYQGPFIQIAFTSDAANVASGINAVVSLIYSSDSASPSQSSLMSVSTRVSASPRQSTSPSVSSSISRSPLSTFTPTLSATASATEFYTGNWTDLGQLNYANSDIANLGSMTINRCMINCMLNPSCGVIVVTSPCNTIPLDSPAVHTSVCGQCWLKITSGWLISADSVSRSLMLYERVYPPTVSTLRSISTSASPLPSRSVVLYSEYNICSSNGGSMVLPFTGSSVLLRTNAAGFNYLDNTNCNFFIYGGTERQFVITYSASFTEDCCDWLTVYNSAGTVMGRNSGTIVAGTTYTVRNTPFIRVGFTTDGSVVNTGIVMTVVLQDVPLSNTVNSSASPIISRTSAFSGTISDSFRKTASGLNSISLSASPITSKSPSSNKSPSRSALPSWSGLSPSPSFSSSKWWSFTGLASISGSVSNSKSTSVSVSTTPSSAPSSSPFISYTSTPSEACSSTNSMSASESNSLSGTPSVSNSATFSDTTTPIYSLTAEQTFMSTYSMEATTSPISGSGKGTGTGNYSSTMNVSNSMFRTVSPSYSISPTLSPVATLSPTVSPSNMKPAGPPPALPANLSALSLSELGGLFDSMANYPPTLIGDNLQKLGMAALANSPGGEFGISTSVFSVKIKSLPPPDNASSSVPLAVGKTAISMPKVAGASAASAIQWTSDPYDSSVPPDSMVLSLNVLDSSGKAVTVKNSSVPIIISMNLVPAADDPRFLPLPTYLADCSKGDIYMKSGPQFLDASAITNRTGYNTWNVPCLLGDWRALNCSASDTVLTYTCPPLIYTPKCQYWDSAVGSWSTDGCISIFSNASLMICSCTHLTDFSSRIQAVAQGNQAIFANAANVYSLDGLIRFAQWYGTFGGIALLTLMLGYFAMVIDKRATQLYIRELLNNTSINLFLEHNPDIPIFSYDPASKYSKIKKSVLKKKIDKKDEKSVVKPMSFLQRVFLHHNYFHFIFKYDPRLSRVFRLLFLFVLQFHSLFLTALLYNFTYSGSPMMWYDTIVLSLITTALNIPVVRILVTSMNSIGMLEFQAQFPLLYEEYNRRLDFETYAMHYIFNAGTGETEEDDSLDPNLKNEMSLLDDDNLDIFELAAIYLCNGHKKMSKKEELSAMTHKDMMRTMVNIVKEPYPYFEQYSVGWQSALCHTWQGALFIGCCWGWLGWCLNYLLLFAAAHDQKVGESIMTSYASSEISTIFFVQPFTIMITTLVYYLVKRYEAHIPNFIKDFFMKRKVKSIPSIYYFSDPWNKKSKSPFTSEFAYNIFVACPAAASGTNPLAYAPINAVAEVIDGGETNKLSEVLILYRRILSVWDDIKNGRVVKQQLPKFSAMRTPLPSPNSIVIRSTDSPSA